MEGNSPLTLQQLYYIFLHYSPELKKYTFIATYGEVHVSSHPYLWVFFPLTEQPD